MQRQLTGAEEGLAMISTAFAKVDELQSHFARIDRLSSRCSRLIHQFPVVKEINRVGRSFRVGTVADWPSSSSPSPPRSQEHFSVSASSYTMQRRSTKVEGREGGRAGKGASERANWMRIPFAPLCDATILCFAVAGTVEHPAGLFDRSASPFPSALLASPFLASPRLASPRLASPRLTLPVRVTRSNPTRHIRVFRFGPDRFASQWHRAPVRSLCDSVRCGGLNSTAAGDR
jgi:hypothetical protein